VFRSLTSISATELEAAHAADLLVALAIRPGNAPVSLPFTIGSYEVPSVTTCDQLLLAPFTSSENLEHDDKRVRIETIAISPVEEDGQSMVSDVVSLAAVSARATVGDDEALTTRSLEDEGSVREAL
jgi:hypothetical protein